MKNKNTRNLAAFLVFLFLSRPSAFFTFIEKFIDFEFYNNLASCSLIETIYLGKRKKRTANTLTKQTVHSYLVPFTWRRYFNIPDFFFVYQIKFGETDQIVVALVTTALKVLLSVAKTNGRLSGREFYAGNVYYSFLNILIHIFSYRHIKKVRNRSHAPKNANSDCCYTKPDKRDNGIRHTTCSNLRFYQIQK